MRSLIAWAIVLVAAPAQAGPVKEHVLGRPDPSLAPYADRVQVSADGTRYAYEAGEAGRWSAVVDGVAGPPADELRDLGFAGNRLVYRVKVDGAWHAVRDGVIGDPYRDMGELVVSADGAHVAFTARTREGTVVVFDRRAGEPFDEVSDLAVAGPRWAYVGRRDRARYPVVDGVVGEPLADVHDLAFSADGTRCAYVANHEGGEQQVVVGDTRWTMEADAFAGDLVWTGDGNLLAWWQTRRGQHSVVIEGRPTEVPNFIRALSVGRTGTIALVSEDLRGQYVVVVRGGEARRDPRHSEVDALTFSRDGRLAYRAWDLDGAHWIVDGVVGPGYQDVVRGGFSPDGRHVAYHATSDGTVWRMIVDGVAGDPADIADGIGPPVWSPDGRHLAYYILDGDPAVVLDGRRVSRISDAVDLRWLARDKQGHTRAGSQLLAFGAVGRDRAIVWRELTP